MCTILTGCGGDVNTTTNASSGETNYESVTEKEDSFDISFEYPYGMWDKLNLTDMDFHTQQEFEEKTTGYIAAITDKLDNIHWYNRYGANLTSCKFTIQYVDTASEGVGGYAQWPTTDGGHGICSTIRLDKSMAEAGINGLPHELTHVICGDCFSRSLSEGIADYMNRICVGYTPATGKTGDVNDWLKEYYEVNVIGVLQGDELESEIKLAQDSMDSVGAAGKDYPFGTGRRSLLWYAYGESFAQYLINTYGVDKVMNLYYTGKSNDDYSVLDSKGYAGILEDWKQYYSTYESTVN